MPVRHFSLHAHGLLRFPHDDHRIELMKLSYPPHMLGIEKMNRVVLYCHDCNEFGPWPPIIWEGDHAPPQTELEEAARGR